MKKIIPLIIATIAILLILGVAYWLLFLRPAEERPVGTPRPTGRGITPAPTKIAEVDIKMIVSGPVLSPTLAADGKQVLFYDQSEGTLKAVLPNGSGLKTLSATKFQRVFNVHWAPNLPRVIFEYLTAGGKRALALFDYEKGETKELDPKIKSLAWSPDGLKIVYSQSGAKGITEILVGDPLDLQKSKRIAALSMTELLFAWPSDDIILFYEKPAPGFESALFDLSPSSQRIRRVVSGIYGLQILAASDPENILVSYTDKSGQYLKLSRIVLGRKEPGPETEQLELELAATVVEKCTWAKDGETAYCAVPLDIPADISIPFDILQGKVVFNDGISVFNVSTGIQKELKPPLNLDTERLIVPHAEDYAVILNRADHSLYSIKL